MALRLKRRAYAPEALIHAGVPAEVVRTLLADGPHAMPERVLLSVDATRRTREATTRYVWGPDAMVLLAEERHVP